MRGKTLAKPQNRLAQHGEHQVRRERDPYGAVLIALGLLQFVLRQHQLAHHQLRPGVQPHARLGQPHTSRFAHQQGHASVFFELTQRLGQGRLSQVQFASGCANAAVLDSGHQGLELVQFHGATV